MGMLQRPSLSQPTLPTMPVLNLLRLFLRNTPRAPLLALTPPVSRQPSGTRPTHRQPPRRTRTPCWLSSSRRSTTVQRGSLILSAVRPPLPTSTKRLQRKRTRRQEQTLPKLTFRLLLLPGESALKLARDQQQRTSKLSKCKMCTFFSISLSVWHSQILGSCEAKNITCVLCHT